MAHLHVHDFSVPALGGGRKCSRWKCGAVSFTPRPDFFATLVEVAEESEKKQKPALAIESSQPSKDAAIHAEETRGRTQTMVWMALKGATDGLTTEEICEATGLDSSTVRPRLVELDRQQRAERVSANRKPWHPVANPEVKTRPNKKGLRMTLWQVTR